MLREIRANHFCAPSGPEGSPGRTASRRSSMRVRPDRRPYPGSSSATQTRLPPSSFAR
jgi:hypothetical protein